MTVPWALAVPVIVFLAIIVPLWMTFHYMTLWRRLRDEKAAQPVSDRELEKLLETAQRLTERLETLETILVEESRD
jgi:phage shock protein B